MRNLLTSAKHISILFNINGKLIDIQTDEGHAKLRRLSSLRGVFLYAHSLALDEMGP
jgi:hypothetical protein